MREIRSSGSEGGGARTSTGSPYPYSQYAPLGLKKRATARNWSLLMSRGKAPETPLEGFPLVSPLAVKRLKQLWITTAEELVAQAATREGKRGLAVLLRLKPEEFEEFIAQVKAALAPATVQAMEEKHPDDKGLGALKPPEQEVEKNGGKTREG